MRQSPNADLKPLASDFELLRAWRAGDEASGRRLFARHFDGVLRFFRDRLPESAEDLTQQTFVACVRGKDRFRGDSSFRTYVFNIARRRLYSFLRDDHRRRRLEAPELETASLPAVGFESPSRAVEVGEQRRRLLRALRRLPIEMQVALELFYWEEMRVGDIADVLETPVGTVKSRLQRARARLDAVMAEPAEAGSAWRGTLDSFDCWARELNARIGAEPVMAAQSSA